ncbi:gp79 [Rhodococcus phage ReqiPine5]|uniref:Gp79 n=1 Tax=Rhodococcus phage ReqiPine5 TaxID=691963 RepID=D4P854_9CAUD|nr:gp79 [Rhodococcus phage ReqiPine5]ADD81184.1 gp79 [Rhodococcus phage ReqiPine5]
MTTDELREALFLLDEWESGVGYVPGLTHAVDKVREVIHNHIDYLEE